MSDPAGRYEFHTRRAARSCKLVPDAPSFRQYVWEDAPCPGCEALVPKPAWRRMAALAGVPEVQFGIAPDTSGGEAYSLAHDVVVLSPAALQLKPCQLAFLVGHEIVHIAQRHFDEDAIALSVDSGKPAHWTQQGATAMQLVDGDFGLALRVSQAAAGSRGRLAGRAARGTGLRLQHRIRRIGLFQAGPRFGRRDRGCTRNQCGTHAMTHAVYRIGTLSLHPGQALKRQVRPQAACCMRG